VKPNERGVPMRLVAATFNESGKTCMGKVDQHDNVVVDQNKVKEGFPCPGYL
jgi:hypothetical protein